MNTCLKTILDKAIYYPTAKEIRDDALDVIFTKLIAIPLQKAWRNKSEAEKKIISEFIINTKCKICFWCSSIYSSNSTRDVCYDCYYEEKYRYEFDD